MIEDAILTRRKYNNNYRAKNKDKINNRLKNWRKNNPDKIKQYNITYWNNKIKGQKKDNLK